MSRASEIRARLDAATPGPWFTDGIGSVGTKPFRGIRRFAQYHVAKTFRSNPDADLIAHAPADLRDLLAVAEAAQVVPVRHESRCSAWNGRNRKCDCRVADLNAALARLDAVTGGEQ